jgi:hypothetical protein
MWQVKEIHIFFSPRAHLRICARLSGKTCFSYKHLPIPACVHLCFCQRLSLYVHMSVSECILCLTLFVSFCTWPPLCVTSLSVHLPGIVSACQTTVCTSLSLLLYVLLCLLCDSLCQSICLFAYATVYLAVCTYICLCHKSLSAYFCVCHRETLLGVSLCVPVSTCSSLWLCVYLCALSRYVFLFECVCLALWMCICLLLLCLSLVFFCLSPHRCACMFLLLSVFICTCLHLCLPECHSGSLLSVCLCLPLCVAVCDYMSMRPSVYVNEYVLVCL